MQYMTQLTDMFNKLIITEKPPEPDYTKEMIAARGYCSSTRGDLLLRYSKNVASSSN